MRDGFDGVFFGGDREVKLDRDASGLTKRGWAGADAAGSTFGRAAVPGVVSGDAYKVDRAGVLTSGGSEPMLGRSGVRKGDLNGFLSVLVASFSLRRLACGVDILICAAALGDCSVQVRGVRFGGANVVCL